MSAARACLVAAATLMLNGCLGRRDTPVPAPSAAVPRPEPVAPAGAPPSQPPPGAASAPRTAIPDAQARSQPAPPAVKTPAPIARGTQPAAPPPVSTARAPKPTSSPAPVARLPQPVAPPAKASSLDLTGLTQQLKETKAIGLFTKIALKNQVDDLLGQFRQHYQGKAKVDIAELRRSYNLLMMKVLSLVQDKDQKLASAIASSRDAIWDLLADPKKFADLKV